MTKKLMVGIVVIIVILSFFIGCKKTEEPKEAVKVGAIPVSYTHLRAHET